ncbi:hypothetical protein C1645_816273 [Glomus cerebriforme]|uniref:Uncharacterized protein n=1 Tax=Glomus cerebriforme TaxID=658196 RepID=A0A397TBU7_9GLOM|nr:hypothetical protein C1645_816273 [Glomus cerebriforme]
MSSDGEKQVIDDNSKGIGRISVAEEEENSLITEKNPVKQQDYNNPIIENYEKNIDHQEEQIIIDVIIIEKEYIIKQETNLEIVQKRQDIKELHQNMELQLEVVNKPLDFIQDLTGAAVTVNRIDNLNIDNIYQLEDPKVLALSKFKLINGKILLKAKMEEEVNIRDDDLINSAVDYLWKFHPSLREHYISHANKVNEIIYYRIQKNSENINRINRLEIPQAVNSIFEDNLFNGVIFNTNNQEAFGTSFS